MRNNVLLYSQMMGSGMGDLLPPPEDYEREARERRAKGEKWASRAAGIVFSGLMLAFGRSAVKFTDKSGAAVDVSTVPTGQLLQAVLLQNEEIQYSQIARETIRPLVEDVTGFVASRFYESDDEARIVARMLSRRSGAGMGGYPQGMGGMGMGAGTPRANFPAGSFVRETSSQYVFQVAPDGSIRWVTDMAKVGASWSAVQTVADGSLDNTLRGPRI